jgi:hypothetical protein
LKATAAQLFRLIESSEDFLLRKFYNYVSFAGYTDHHGSDLESWRAILRRTVTRFLSYLQRSDSPEELPVNEEISRSLAGADGVTEAQGFYQRGFLLGRILGIIKYSRDSFLNLADSGIPKPRNREKAHLLIRRYFDKFEIGFVDEWVNLELGSHRMLDVTPSEFLGIRK